jgi:hypothetical protein
MHVFLKILGDGRNTLQVLKGELIVTVRENKEQPVQCLSRQIEKTRDLVLNIKIRLSF